MLLQTPRCQIHSFSKFHIQNKEPCRLSQQTIGTVLLLREPLALLVGKELIAMDKIKAP